MKMPSRFALLLLGLVPLSPAFADDDCKEITSSTQADHCAELAMKNADSQLNTRYHELMARLETQYKRDPQLGAAYAVKVKEAQRAWVKLRDTNCAVEAFEIGADKPAYATAVNNCITRMSQERSVELDGIAPPAIACPSTDFADFLASFSERVDVQKVFVQRPLQLVTTVAGDSEPEMNKNTLSDEQIKFPLMPDRARREADGLTLSVKEQQGNTATALLQKPDTDYVFEYRFVRGQCWVLREVMDYSL